MLDYQALKGYFAQFMKVFRRDSAIRGIEKDLSHCIILFAAQSMTLYQLYKLLKPEGVTLAQLRMSARAAQNCNECCSFGEVTHATLIC